MIGWRAGYLSGVLVFTLALSASGCAALKNVPMVPDPAPSQGLESPDGSLIEVSLPSGYGARNSWIEIYFTDPESPLAGQETGGLDELLVTAIDSARLSVDLAIYSLSLRNVRDALIRAHERGTRVRIVIESDNQDRSAVQDLRDAGIPLLGDRREGLMHNKFMVIDRVEVWLGSMNFTYSGVYEDNNALLRVRSQELAESYLAEFDEMFVEDQFGTQVNANTPNPEIEIEGVRVEVMFSPDDGVQDRLVSILRKSKESVYFMAFSFTDDDLGEAIRVRAERGVDVAGVMDADQIKFNIGTEYDYFVQDGLKVFLDGYSGQMHHKAIIVDEEILIAGSYNFTRSAATRNDENVIIIHDEEIAGYFLQEFQRIFESAQE
jgi:phosphatidylserine/phosphatidylglycerophosphate/cardiolipin synthase-like enzyme